MHHLSECTGVINKHWIKVDPVFACSHLLKNPHILTVNTSWIALQYYRSGCFAVLQRPWSGKACTPQLHVPALLRHVAIGTAPSAASVAGQPTQTSRWSWKKPAATCHQGLDLTSRRWYRVTHLAPGWKKLEFWTNCLNSVELKSQKVTHSNLPLVRLGSPKEMQVLEAPVPRSV